VLPFISICAALMAASARAHRLPEAVVLIDFDCGHEIQTQQRQVRKIVLFSSSPRKCVCTQRNPRIILRDAHPFEIRQFDLAASRPRRIRRSLAID